jgi:hypothetical protein
MNFTQLWLPAPIVGGRVHAGGHPGSVRQRRNVVAEGIYEIKFAGPDGTGSGVIVLKDGRLVGTDGGVDYAGTYTRPGFFGAIRADVVCTVHPGTKLVMGGGPQLYPDTFPVTATFPLTGSGPLAVALPPGSPPVTANISYLRPLP